VKTLVLWDIDGTLVDVKGAGRRAFIHGIERAWGVVDDLADVKFAGATDLGVLASLRQRLHLPEVHTRAFFEHMAAHLERTLLEGVLSGANSGHASPVDGAVHVVRALHERGVVQGLVTGNARATAFVKLKAAGIDASVFVAGAYGDEHADRNELARRALVRAQESGAHVQGPGARTFLVGDTARDVEAAKIIGAVAIALLRRVEERDALVRAGADHVIERLDEALAIIG
jgi:phosphoglycolate phosphatase